MKRFNTICIAVSLFFILGTFWIWKGTIRGLLSDTPQTVIEDVPTLTRDDFGVEIINDAVEEDDKVEKKEVALSEDTINLAVPFTSQAPEKNWDQPWQDACEEASILMIDAYYKGYGLSPLFSKDELQKMIDWEEKWDWGGSISIEKVKEIFVDYLNYENIKIVQDPTIEQIKKYIDAGKPVLVVADGKVLPNPNFTNGGPVYHALVIRGYTDTEFITNDPGTQFGKNFIYEYNDLMESIRDWNRGNVKTGERRILVIE
jgi:hypothetical protein